jgi:hypothetical protein
MTVFFEFAESSSEQKCKGKSKPVAKARFVEFFHGLK